MVHTGSFRSTSTRKESKMSEYSTPAMSAGVMAGVRIVALILGPYAIGKGWVTAENFDGILTGVVTAGVAAYGVVKTFKRQKVINKAEAAIGPIKA